MGIAVLLLIGTATLLVLGPLVIRTRVSRQTRDQIFASGQDLPPVDPDLPGAWPAAIVFGAGYWPSGRLSDALADRMETAIALYQAGLVNKLLLTGDNRVVDYNEPAAMANYALARGVLEGDLVLDYAGRRTYDSCYRARAIFGLDEAVLVTQAFHLPRALYTCNHLGLKVVGVVADRHRYEYGDWYRLRELLALARAWFDVKVFKPELVLGDPIHVDWSSRQPIGP